MGRMKFRDLPGFPKLPKLKFPKPQMPKLSELGKMPERIDPAELGIIGPVPQDCIHCGASWILGTDKPLQRCPSCRRWQVPFWKRDLPRWLVWTFVAVAGPAIAYFVVRIIQLYLFPE